MQTYLRHSHEDWADVAAGGRCVCCERNTFMLIEPAPQLQSVLSSAVAA